MLRVYQGNTSPERENAFTGRCVPIPSKCAPSSCYTQQRLDKKKLHRKLPALIRNFNVKNNSIVQKTLESKKTKKVYQIRGV